MCFVLNLKQRSSLHAAAPSGSRYVNRKGGEGMKDINDTVFVRSLKEELDISRRLLAAEQEEKKC